MADARPEMFDTAERVKKICAPAYVAALYRHFLTGLSEPERLLLSRQGAVTFRKAVEKLFREEAVAETSAEFRRSTAESLEVSWADPVAGRVGARTDRRWRPGSSPPGSGSAGGGWRARRGPIYVDGADGEDDTDGEDFYTDNAAGVAGGGAGGWRRRGQSSPGGGWCSRAWRAARRLRGPGGVVPAARDRRRRAHA